MRKRFSLLPTYHFEENTDGQIRGAAERVLRDCTIYGNCGRNLINLDAGIDSDGVLAKNDDGTYKLTKQSTSRFAKIIPVRIPANTRFVISYELIEYTGVEKYLPVQMVLKFSGRENTTVAPYNDKSTNKKIYSTSWMFVNDIIAIQLYYEGNSAQPVGSYTVFKNFQIELGNESYSEGIDYEPYKEVGDSDAESGKYILPVTVSGKNVFNWDAVSTVQDVIAPNTSSLTILDNGAIIKGLSNPTIGIASAYSNGWFRPGISTDTHNRGSFYVKKGCSVQITADVRLIELSENYTDNNYTNIYLYGTESHTSGNFSVTLPTDGTVKRVSATHEVKTSGMYYPVFTLNSNTLEIMNIQCTIKHTDGTWDSEDYEPYTAPKTTNLLLDAPLGPGESISCREKGLLVPELATIDPNITNYITFGSEVKPSSAKFYYYKY